MPRRKLTTQGFEYQLGLIRLELEMIQDIITKLDEVAQSIKNWAVVTWAGSIALLLQEPNLRKFIIFTIALPIVFWYSDALWRRLQQRSIYRQQKIHDFLNGEDFIESCKQQRLINFAVIDPVGRQYRDRKDFNDALKIKWMLQYREIRYFYEGLILISLLLGAFFLLEAFGYIQL